jgi:tetratricopeptide (TPR) repeat protein
MALRHTLRAGVAAVALASVLAPSGAGLAKAAQATAGGLQVKVGQAETFSKLEFQGRAVTGTTRIGQVLTFSFAGDADPDISRLRTAPPRWVKTAEKIHVGGRLQIAVTLADDADAKVGAADGATFVNIFAKPPLTPAQIAAANAPPPEPPRPNPIPAGGVVHMGAQVTPAQVLLTFGWANPAGAAVFRRGDTVWVVFDAPARLDVSHAPKGVTQFSGLQVFRGADYAAVRIDAAHNLPVFASAVGAVWTIALGPGHQAPPSLVRVTRDDSQGPAGLKVAVSGATRIIRFSDPDVGDTLSVVTALGPSKGLPSRRDFVQAAFLPSIQGLAVEAHADDLTLSHDVDIVSIVRPRGLTLSPRRAAKVAALADADAPAPAAMPALIDAKWGRTGEGGFLKSYNSLLSAAMRESGNTDGAAPTVARMALARFLVGSDLSFEAIGLLNDAARASPRLTDNAEFRGLRGVARVMARRYKEAAADFSAPVLVEDPSSSLWRGYVASQQAQWAEARSDFAKGADAFNQFSPTWRARFARADAQAALALGDTAAAEARIRLALSYKTDVSEELATRLLQARIFEREGHQDRALKMYAAIATAPIESLSSPALLRATQIRLQTGKLSTVQAATVFDGLRYRWRGDATELETIRALGQLYLGQGRYREALEALRSAGVRMPDLPEALQLQADLSAAFRALFLGGMADGLEPVQALALFYDFKDLTPIGSDGDQMVRKLVRRLVDVDLLSPAAELLKYQVDNRLDGVPKAQVASDLAVIYLMDRQPEKALQAINGSRTTALPAALNAERRIIEARGWAGVGRFDSALEIIERDKSKDAQDLRAEISWKQKDWPKAGPVFEKALGDRWKNPAALSAEEEGKLLRAGVAYSLAGDNVALARLNGQYSAFYATAHNPDALRIALAGVPEGRLSVADFSRVSADNEAFVGWVAKMKVRFKEAPAPVSPVATAKQAAAAPTVPVAKG